MYQVTTVIYALCISFMSYSILLFADVSDLLTDVSDLLTDVSDLLTDVSDLLTDAQ